VGCGICGDCDGLGVRSTARGGPGVVGLKVRNRCKWRLGVVRRDSGLRGMR
jgi:hypothetical protein